MASDIFTIFQATELETLYVEYCRSRPTADEILNRPESIEYWEVSSDLLAISFFDVLKFKGCLEERNHNYAY